MKNRKIIIGSRGSKLALIYAEKAREKILKHSKDFGIGAQILHDLNISKIQLISNSKQTKRVGMIGYGLEITDYVNY